MTDHIIVKINMKVKMDEIPERKDPIPADSIPLLKQLVMQSGEYPIYKYWIPNKLISFYRGKNGLKIENALAPPTGSVFTEWTYITTYLADKLSFILTEEDRLNKIRSRIVTNTCRMSYEAFDILTENVSNAKKEVFEIANMLGLN